MSNTTAVAAAVASGASGTGVSGVCEREYQMNDLRRFYHLISINIDVQHNILKSNLQSILNGLIRNGKTQDILKEIISYSNKHQTTTTNVNTIDALTYTLAFIVKSRLDQRLTNMAYNTLKDISDTPTHLFSFIYYHKYLLDEEARHQSQDGPQRYGKGWGKGQRKAVIKWYNGRSEEDILRLVTKYRHSHTWSNKDIIKMARIKPCSDGIELIFKYLLFGYDKIKNEKATECDRALFEFIKDYENLKTVQTGEDAAILVRKHKFHLEHLPGKLQRHREIWEALVEDMQIQQLCQYIGVLTSKRLLRPDTRTFKFVLDKILSKEQIQLAKIHPIYPCLALQIYLQVTELLNAADDQQSSPPPAASQDQNGGGDAMRDALFNAFQLSSNIQAYSSNKRILCVVEVNSFMRNSHTDGLKFLNPIDTVASILLTLKYTEDTKCDIAIVTDKLNLVESLPTKQQNLDLNHIDQMFQQYESFERNPNDLAISSSSSSTTDYDVFIYFMASNYNERLLIDLVQSYRLERNLPNTKLVVVRLHGRSNQLLNELPPSISVSTNLNLFFTGWSMDSYDVLKEFISDQF